MQPSWAWVQPPPPPPHHDCVEILSCHVMFAECHFWLDLSEEYGFIFHSLPLQSKPLPQEPEKVVPYHDFDRVGLIYLPVEVVFKRGPGDG